MPKIYRYYRMVLRLMLAIFMMALLIALIYRLYRSDCYESAQKLMIAADYDGAKIKFKSLGDYRDCESYLKLLTAINSIEQEQYKDAIAILQSLGNFADAPSRLFDARYEYAQQLYEEGNFQESAEIFAQLLNETTAKEIFPKLESDENKAERFKRLKHVYGQQLFSQKDYASAITVFEDLGDFYDSKEWLNKSMYALALELINQGDFLTAINYFLDLGNYEKSAQYVEEILASGTEVDIAVLYKAACRHFDAKLYWQALAEFQSLDGYSDSEKYIENITIMLRQSLSTTVSVGQRYTVAVDNEGKALTTGFDPNGRSNVNNDRWTDLVSISGFSDITAGLKSDGTVITTSKNLNNEIEKTDSPWQNADIVAISVGNSYIVGLDSDGTLKSAGHDAGDGQREVDDWTDIVAIATGWRHTVGLNFTGNVLITGYGSSRQFNQMQLNKEDWNNIIAVAAGGGGNVGNGHTVGLREDGKVVAVGDNEFNQCEVDLWENIVAIAAGDWFTMGLDKDGQIFITKPSQDVIDKYNLYSDVLNAENWPKTGLVAIAAGGGSAIGLYGNGDVIAAGYGQYNQKNTANNWSNIMVYS